MEADEVHTTFPGLLRVGDCGKENEVEALSAYQSIPNYTLPVR